MISSKKIPVWAIALTDTIIIFTVVLSVQFLWPVASYIQLNGFQIFGNSVPIYLWVSLTIAVLWNISLLQSGSLKQRNLGTGSREYSLVTKATVFTFILVTLSSYLVKAEIARGFLLISVPLGLVLLLVGRWLWRKYVAKARGRGQFMLPAVIVGSEQTAVSLAQQLSLHPEVGLVIVGIFISNTNNRPSFPTRTEFGQSMVPIWGTYDDVLRVVREKKVHHIIASSSEELEPEKVRKLSWQLLPGNENLYLAANILDVTGPRLLIRPVAGIPLIEIVEPELEGLNQFVKRVLDLLLSAILIIATSPLMIFAASRIKKFDGGKVFFSQYRVGKNGKLFRIYKFRTMRLGAERERDELSPEEHLSAENGVLFKLKDDPRVTVPGRWLRRTSLDELPQLFNVVIGNMSLVGPRPPLPSETDDYEAHVHTRFLVKPGITGLWQVSGRSDLTWEESVRADLTYVQNWSLISDFIILWRTIKVVISGKGAY